MDIFGQEKILALHDQAQGIKDAFKKFTSLHGIDKDACKKELDKAIPHFLKCLKTFDDSKLQEDESVEKMRLDVNGIQARLSMNLPSTTGGTSGDHRLSILS
jgi:hypothetical protein